MRISTSLQVLDDEVLKEYLSYCENSVDWIRSKSATIWSERIIHHADVPPLLRRNNIAILGIIENTLRTEYRISRKIYPDYCGLVRWRIGDFQRPHADGENPDGSKHQFHWRKFSSILYLNQDYTGGGIYFPNQNVELKPTANTLVFFPGTLEFLHGVKAVKSGVRYTLTSFWTYDHNHDILAELRHPN